MPDPDRGRQSTGGSVDRQTWAEAEEVAVTNEDRAWRYSDPFEQGKSRRVRHELWRRFEGGKGGAEGEWSAFQRGEPIGARQGISIPSGK